MNDEIARVLIRSLTGRLIGSDGSYRLPDAVLSSDEVAALMHLSINIEEQVHLIESPKIVLNLSALEARGADENDLRLCLDFGTAMSKAWATGRTVGETLPLVLGKVTGGGDSLVVPSSIYIGRTGRIHFGADADRVHRQDDRPGRIKFDNLKRMLSEIEVGTDLYSSPLKVGIDPTDSELCQGDMLVLYLAWLTDHSLKALQEALTGLSLPGVVNADLRFTRRRFAIPCFEDAVDEKSGGKKRADWALNAMRTAVLHSQIVADTIGKNWPDLNISQAVDVLRQVRKLDAGRLNHLLTSVASIREPIAAGASLFNDEIFSSAGKAPPNRAVRRFLMIVDAGAGTTDFAIFQVIDYGEEGDLEYTLLKPSVRMSRIAGNVIDDLLIPLALEACDIDPSSGLPRSKGDFDYIRADLASQIREIKRELFENGEAAFDLKPNASGRLDRQKVSEDSRYMRYGRELKEIRDASVRSIFDPVAVEAYKQIAERFGRPIPISMLLTGGSAALPIVRDLADGRIEISGVPFAFNLIDKLPGWVNNLPREAATLVEGVYPQAAVAIGGSALTLPREIEDRISSIDPDLPGKRHLQAYQVSGAVS
jgi:molecular chaperone HscA